MPKSDGSSMKMRFMTALWHISSKKRGERAGANRREIPGGIKQDDDYNLSLLPEIALRLG
jgi:hypothetical protein